jgi:DNA-binding CsgD family transcriptional regulator
MPGGIMENHTFMNSNINLSLHNPIHLSPREKECLSWVANGLSNKEMARKMDISPRTVESYIAALKFKLNCTSRFKLLAKLMNQNCMDS